MLKKITIIELRFLQHLKLFFSTSISPKIKQHFYFDKADRASAESVSEWENELKNTFKLIDVISVFQ